MPLTAGRPASPILSGCPQRIAHLVPNLTVAFACQRWNDHPYMPLLTTLMRLVRPGTSRVYAGLRQQALGLPGSAHAHRMTPVGDDLLALLVESPVGHGDRATLACVCDGTTSLYRSNGGGFIGAGEVPSVREVARELLEIAATMSASDRSRWARSGRPKRDVRFDFVTTSGVATAWADMDRPTDRTALLRVVHVHAQRVITEIRVAESERPTAPAGA